jgi:hypothetical protein
VNAEQFFHVCRSAAAIANVREIRVFGAAAVLPWAREQAPAPPSWPSMEVDLDPGSQELADLVDASIGEASLFEESFGVHAHGVLIEAFVAPADWPSRSRAFVDPESSVRIVTPHPLDLTVAKLVRGDPRDWEFAEYCRLHFGLSVGAVCAGLQGAAAARPAYAAAALAAVPLVSTRLR